MGDQALTRNSGARSKLLFCATIACKLACAAAANWIDAGGGTLRASHFLPLRPGPGDAATASSTALLATAGAVSSAHSAESELVEAGRRAADRPQVAAQAMEEEVEEGSILVLHGMIVQFLVTTLHQPGAATLH